MIDKWKSSILAAIAFRRFVFGFIFVPKIYVQGLFINANSEIEVKSFIVENLLIFLE